MPLFKVTATRLNSLKKEIFLQIQFDSPSMYDVLCRYRRHIRAVIPDDEQNTFWQELTTIEIKKVSN